MSAREPLRTLLVDDEEPARELLRSFLQSFPEVAVVGEAGDGASALALIESTAPDLVFLDVQMPGMSGLDVAMALPPDRTPLIVFVTAYEQYALRAFEVSACDYLLKPFDAERLAGAMRRVLARRAGSGSDVLAALRAMLNQGRRDPGQVVVKAGGRHVFLDADEVLWIEAVGKTSRLHLGNGTLDVSEAIGSLASRLDASRFLRVHRSAIVNRAQIREVQPWFKGNYVLILKRGTRIVSGRTYRHEVQKLVGNP